MKTKVLLGCLVIAMCSGCELYTKVGVRPVNEHQESQKTYDRPLKCLFVSCTAETELQEK